MINDQMIDSNTPVVSIIVITYNSSKFVLETLESAKAQTYNNIELIISDDASQDDTVTICREWLQMNSDRFLRTELVTVDKNSGIPANCNRGIKVSSGVWIKLIAGDDILLKDCISTNVKQSVLKPEASIFFSDAVGFTNYFNSTQQINLVKTPYFEIFININDPQIQYQYILRYNPVVACSLFIKNELFSMLNFDERYRFIEDRPFLLNCTKQGVLLNYINQETVLYRIHSESIQDISSIFKIQKMRIREFEKDYILGNITKIEKMFLLIYDYFYLLAFKLNINKIHKLSLIYSYFIIKPLSKIVNFTSKRLIKNILNNY